MPKRKRDADSTPTGSRALDIRISSLKIRIEQGASLLKKALNLARGFERQKLGRRQKAASKEPKTLLRLREEVIVLRQLDVGIVAERQLIKRLGKVKRITENSAYAHGYGEKDVEGPKHGAEANVVGRLMNSNPVKECLPGVIEGVFEVLGIEQKGDKSKHEESNGERAAKKETSESRKAYASELFRAEDDQWSGSESENNVDVSMDGTDPEDAIDDQNPASSGDMSPTKGSAGCTDFSGFSDRIAISSEGGSEKEDFFDRKTATQIEMNHEKTSRASLLIPLSSPSPTPFDSPKPQKKEIATRPSSSAVPLPSLMMGGYYSGSESASDIEDNRTKVRKNRRGQRERQKIAEAKFGVAAKHLTKQDNGNRNAGWDPKRGATDGKMNSKGGMRIGRPSNTKGPTGSNGDVLGARKNLKEKVKDGPLHPSWEAAKKRKAQSKITINGNVMGKKITFD